MATKNSDSDIFDNSNHTNENRKNNKGNEKEINNYGNNSKGGKLYINIKN